jgi:hypothetical protein
VWTGSAEDPVPVSVFPELSISMSTPRGANVAVGPRGTYTPGSAVARNAGASVVAYGGLDPRTLVRVRARLHSPGAHNAFSARSGNLTTAEHDEECYMPYVHIVTGERALVPVIFDPVTGTRRTRVRIHPDLVPLDGASEVPSTGADAGGGVFATIVGMASAIMNCMAPTPQQPQPAPLPTPTPPRRIDFGADRGTDADNGAEQADEERVSRRLALASATLENFRVRLGKLELENIGDYIVDFKAAVGRVDTEAHRLLVDPFWREVMANEPEWALRANKRIATAIDGSIDKDAPNVIRLMTILRKADAGDRPGLLFSGMDMLEEIQALVDGRTVGEIKLNTKDGEKIVFKLRLTIDENRLLGNRIEKQFELKPEGERVARNALHHEFIKKIPDTTDVMLTLQKKMYETDLFKSELDGVEPPWTTDQLVDRIAVDLATAPSTAQLVRSELSVIDQKSNDVSPTYVCSNCGKIGEHNSANCGDACKKCGFNFCIGNSACGAACAVAFDKKPSTRPASDFMTAFRKQPLLPFLMAKLDAAWKQRHPNEVSAVECDAQTDDSESDDDGGFGLAYDRSA